MKTGGSARQALSVGHGAFQICNAHFASGIKHSTSGIEHLASGIEHLESGIEHLESGIEHLASGIEHLESGIEHLASGIEHLASGIEHLASGIEHSASGMEHSAAPRGQAGSASHLDEVTHSSRAQAGGQTVHTLLGDNRAEAADHALVELHRVQLWCYSAFTIVLQCCFGGGTVFESVTMCVCACVCVRGGVWYLHACLDDVNRAEGTMRDGAADTTGQRTLCA
jgi:exonuclease VII small subunit